MSYYVNITLCSLIQRCEVHQIFVFYVFYCNLKENDHIRRNVNSKKKEMFICEISIIVLTCQKLGLAGPVQQKIKLPSPYLRIIWKLQFLMGFRVNHHQTKMISILTILTIIIRKDKPGQRH